MSPYPLQSNMRSSTVWIMIEHLIAEPMFAERPFAVKHFADIGPVRSAIRPAGGAIRPVPSNIRSVRLVEGPGRTRFARVAMLASAPAAPQRRLAAFRRHRLSTRRPLTGLGARRRRDCHTPAAV